MEKGALAILITIGAIVLIGAYLFFFTNVFKSCPASCDDFNKCTEDTCSQETGFECLNKPIENCCGNSKCETGETYANCADDCPNCDDLNKCTDDSYDYHLQECLNKEVTPCCGNGQCESTESKSICPEDCIFGEREHIEFGASYLNNPEHFTDSGQRFFYSIENCLSDTIETLEITPYYDEAQGETLTKQMLEGMGFGTAEYNFINIADSTCGNRLTLIRSATNNFALGTTHSVKIRYKFKYKGKTFEFTSPAANIPILDKEPMKGMEEFAIFTIDNSNIVSV